MPVTDLPVALTCFAGYVVQLVANIWLMPGPEMFNPGAARSAITCGPRAPQPTERPQDRAACEDARAGHLQPPPPAPLAAATKYLGHWCYLTYQTNLLSTLYFGASVVACVAPSAELDTALMALYPLFFTLGVFITTAYYALDHTNPTNVRIKSSLQRQGWRWIWVSSHVEHALSLPIAILYACSIRYAPLSRTAPDLPTPCVRDRPRPCRMPLLLSSADELELVRSCRYACLLMYIAAYFALTLGARSLSSRPRSLPTPLHHAPLLYAGNKLATGLWIYPVFNDAEVRDPRATAAAARAARTHCTPQALGGRLGVFLLMSAVAIVALAIATLGIHLVDRRN